MNINCKKKNIARAGCASKLQEWPQQMLVIAVHSLATISIVKKITLQQKQLGKDAAQGNGENIMEDTPLV